MTKCFYCGREEAEYKGTIVVDSVSSKVKYYCSSKCRKNAEMKRKKKKWARFQEGNKPAAKAVFKQQ